MRLRHHPGGDRRRGAMRRSWRREETRPAARRRPRGRCRTSLEKSGAAIVAAGGVEPLSRSRAWPTHVSSDGRGRPGGAMEKLMEGALLADDASEAWLKNPARGQDCRCQVSDSQGSPPKSARVVRVSVNVNLGTPAAAGEVHCRRITRPVSSATTSAPPSAPRSTRARPINPGPRWTPRPNRRRRPTGSHPPPAPRRPRPDRARPRSPARSSRTASIYSPSRPTNTI